MLKSGIPDMILDFFFFGNIPFNAVYIEKVMLRILITNFLLPDTICQLPEKD